MKGSPVTHFAVRGLSETASIPACGAWSRDLASRPEDVRCEDCKATLDYAMAAGKEDGR